MSIAELQIHSLRNITSTHLHIYPQCNFFYGKNGSGKTSLLEAVYLLSSGYSFRTRETAPLLRHGDPSLTVFSRMHDGDSVSIQKLSSGPTKVLLNGQSCRSSSELAWFLPCQVFYSDIFHIMDAGPTVRRTLLDWGLFHVEQSYHSVWKQYRSVLKQRNALLRQKASQKYFVPWDAQLVFLGNELDTLRRRYFDQWSSTFYTILSQLTDLPCTMVYYKGWDRKQTGRTLQDSLADQWENDRQRQYTQSGPHQADILFDVSLKRAKLLLSRGQQKVVLLALKLAQAHLLIKDCIYLLDDVMVELDHLHMSRLCDVLSRIKGQFFFTAVNEELLPLLQRSFDVKSYEIQNGVFFSK